MIVGEHRVCDICDHGIPRGTPYRIGYTTPEAFEAAMKGATEYTKAGHTLTEDGRVRIEVCLECWHGRREPELYPEEKTDPLH